MTRESFIAALHGTAVVLAFQATAALATEEPVTIQFSPYIGRLVTIPAAVEQKPVRLLLDTGGGQTLISPHIAASLGCTPHGRAVGFRMNGERVDFQYCDRATLQIGGRAFTRSPIAVWDVMSVLPKDVPPLDGVLALDTLAEQPFTLDLGARTLTLESAESLERRLPAMKRLEARVANGVSGAEVTVLVRGSLDEPGWFLFDSGNLDLIQAAPHMLRGNGALPRVVDSMSLTINGLPPVTAQVRVREMIHDGALSESFLRDWVWTFRLATGELWAARAR